MNHNARFAWLWALQIVLGGWVELPSTLAAQASAPMDDEYVVARAERRLVDVDSSVRVWVEVIGECAIDAQIEDPPPVDGIDYDVHYDPITSHRTESTSTGERTRYVARYRIDVTPRRPGSFLLGPFQIVCPSETTLQSDRVEIVARGAEVKRDGVTLRLEGERPWVYEREPIEVKVELSFARELYPTSSHEFEFPWLSSLLWLERRDGALGPREKAFEIRDGRKRVILSESDPGGVTGDTDRVILSGHITGIPTRSGRVDLGGSRFRGVRSATLGARVRDSDRIDATSLPAAIDVRPLPTDGKPDGYIDAVGDFQIASSATPTAVGVGASLRLRVAVTETRPRTTNLPFARLLELGPLAQFETHGDVKIDREGSTCRFEWELSPSSVFATEIPSISLHTFDPVSATYRTIATAPLPITITSANDSAAANVPDRGGIPVTSRWPLRWLLWGVVAVILIAAMRRRVSASKSEPTKEVERERRQRTIDALLRDAAEPVGAIAARRLLERYFSARLGLEAGAAGGEAALDALQRRGIDEATVQSVRQLFERAEIEAYGRTGEEGAEEEATSCRALLDELERQCDD